MTMQSVLIVAPDCPFPPRHGGRLDVWNRASALQRSGNKVTILTQSQNAAEIGEYIRDEIVIHCSPRDSSPLNLISFRPYQFTSRRALGRSALLAGWWDTIVLESHYLIHLASVARPFCRRLILREHNREPAYLTELARCEHSLIKRAYLHLEAAKVQLAARSSEAILDDVWCISDEETELFRNEYSSAEVTFVPPCFPPEAFGFAGADGNRLCFIGRLDGPDTKAALQWYFEELHADVSALGVRLLIAGRAETGSAIAVPSDVECIKNPPEVRSLLAQARAIIVPIKGVRSGTKMKVVEAYCAGVEILTTPEGASGLPQEVREHLWICSTKAEFLAAVRTLYSLETRALNARRSRRLAAASRWFSETSFGHRANSFPGGVVA